MIQRSALWRPELAAAGRRSGRGWGGGEQHSCRKKRPTTTKKQQQPPPSSLFVATTKKAAPSTALQMMYCCRCSSAAGAGRRLLRSGSSLPRSRRVGRSCGFVADTDLLQATPPLPLPTTTTTSRTPPSRPLCAKSKRGEERRATTSNRQYAASAFQTENDVIGGQ